jgi:hypothetical protein
MPSRRAAAASAGLGVVHAALLLVAAVALGYPIGPSQYSLVGLLWRYGGLVVVAALPAWLWLRHRLVLPSAALVLTSGYVLGMELTPPGPTFRDVAELEGLPEPTGILVVENGLYVVRYMVNASVWTVGFLLVGVVEHVARTRWRRLPPVRDPSPYLATPAPRRRAAAVAAGVGALHAAVMVWFSLRLGLSASGGLWWAQYAASTAGMWLLGAVPTYLLVRHAFVGPAALFALMVLNDVRTEFTATVDDPHALYFGAWFLFLVPLLVVAGGEAGLRWLLATRDGAGGG